MVTAQAWCEILVIGCKRGCCAAQGVPSFCNVLLLYKAAELHAVLRWRCRPEQHGEGTQATEGCAVLRRTFQRVWRLGIPVVVRGVRRGFDWAPHTMMRATTERGNKARGTEKDTTLEVGISPNSLSFFLQLGVVHGCGAGAAYCA